MKCIICYGEDIQVTEVKEELKRENDIVYVPVQIPVCQTCGERITTGGRCATWRK